MSGDEEDGASGIRQRRMPARCLTLCMPLVISLSGQGVRSSLFSWEYYFSSCTMSWPSHSIAAGSSAPRHYKVRLLTRHTPLGGPNNEPLGDRLVHYSHSSLNPHFLTAVTTTSTSHPHLHSHDLTISTINHLPATVSTFY